MTEYEEQIALKGGVILQCLNPTCYARMAARKTDWEDAQKIIKCRTCGNTDLSRIR